MRPGVPKSRFAAALAAAVIAGATLVPSESGGGGSGICVVCGERGLADFLLNVGLFSPLGAARAAAGASALSALALGGAFSLLIELAQVFLVAGRDSSVGDLLANTLGTGTGWLMLHALVKGHNMGSRIACLLPSLVAVGVLTALLLGLWLMSPDYSDRLYYLQWTADFENMEHYQGEVVTSVVGALELRGPPGPIEETDAVRELLEIGAAVGVVVRAGPPPDGLAPILGIYDDLQREMVLIAADEANLVYRYRLVGERLRLDRADIRFAGALEEVEPGTVVELAVSPGRAKYCAAVAELTQCVPGFSVGDTRMLLYYREGWTGPVRQALAMAWLAILFFPAGLVGRSWRSRAGALPITAVALPIIPRAMGFAMTPLSEVGAAIAGVLAGGLTAHCVRWPEGSDGTDD